MTNMTAGKERIDELINEARAFAFTQPDESLRLLDKAIEAAIQANEYHHLALAYETRGTVCINAGRVQDAYTYYQYAANTWQQDGNERDMLEALNRLATATTLLGNWDEANEILNRSLQASIKLNDDHLRAMALMNLANLQIRKGDLDKAVESSIACATIFRQRGDFEKLLPVLINLGVVYGMLKEDDNALAIYESALDVASQCDDKNNVVNLYINLSELYVRRNRYDDALTLLKDGKGLATKANYRRGFGYLCSTLGNAYMAIDKMQMAYLNMLRAERILVEENDDYQLAQVYLDAGKLLLTSGKNDKALLQFNNAYDTATTQQAAYIQMEACNGVANTLAAMGKYNEAYTKLKEYQGLRETIFNEDKARSVSEMQAKYELEQRKREAEKMKLELAEFNLKLLRSQMNPHFIFNSINSINNFVLKRETQQASTYLLKFSQLMRLILDHSAQQKISLAKEIQFLENYLLLESLRFDQPFKYHIEVDEELSIHSTMIPPMILQPYIENAIWHGLANRSSAGNILISIGYQDDLLLCVIEDDGVGRRKAGELNQTNNHQSKGLSITTERLRYLGAEQQNKQWLTIDDLVDKNGMGIGTRVSVLLPVI